MRVAETGEIHIAVSPGVLATGAPRITVRIGRRVDCAIRIIVALIATLSPLVASSPARAAGLYEATLRDGAIYRGELIESVPGYGLTLKLANGAVKQIDWRELAAPLSPIDGPQSPLATPAIVPPTPPPSGVLVTIRSNNPAISLDRVLGTSIVVDGWHAVGPTGAVLMSHVQEHLEPVCGVPCNRVLDRSAPFVLHGPNVMPSEYFRLPESGDHVLIDVRAGSQRARQAGWWLIFPSIVPILIGVIGVPAELADSSLNAAGRSEGALIFAPFLLGGAAMMAGGIYLVVHNKTKVTINPDRDELSLRVGSVALGPTGLRF
jgi:hypothetical protein